MQTSIISKKTKGSLKSKGVVFKTILILSLFFISTFGTVNDISVNKNDGNDIIQDFDTESLSVAADGIDNLVFSDDFNDGNYDGWIVDRVMDS